MIDELYVCSCMHLCFMSFIHLPYLFITYVCVNSYVIYCIISSFIKLAYVSIRNNGFDHLFLIAMLIVFLNSYVDFDDLYIVIMYFCFT